MQISRRDGQSYLAELTDEERVALLWAVETGRALLLHDPDIACLGREKRFGVDFLDRLADTLFLVGASASAQRRGTDPIAWFPDPHRRL